MRIGWVIYGGLEQLTGGYVYDRLVIERLRRGGDEVEVISLAPRGLAGARAGVRLAARLRSLRADVIVGDELCFPELASGFRCARGYGARVLLVHHLTSWEPAATSGAFAYARELVTRALEAAALRASDAVIATSAPTAARLAREHGVAAAVAEPGADRLRRGLRARDPEDRRVSLLFVGALTPRKAVLELLEALALAHASGCCDLELTLLGDGTRDLRYATAVRAAIARTRALGARVRLLGPVSDERLERALACADALVMPSRFEGYGMVISEALAQGTPVITSTTGAAKALVRDGVDGILVPPGDAAELARALARFGGDEAARGAMRCAASERRALLPTWDATARAFRSALARAAGQGDDTLAPSPAVSHLA